MNSDIKSEFKTDETGNPAGGITNGTGLVINWQNGPIRDLDPGRNGAQVEDVIDAVIQRLEFLNTATAGRFKCIENDRALQDLRNARRWMDIRTSARRKRGVEGTHRP